MKKKWIACVIAAMMTTTAFTGCGSTEEKPSESQAEEKSSNQEESSESQEEPDAQESQGETETEAGNLAAEGENVYPLDTDETLVYWGQLNWNVAVNFNSLGDTEYGKQWQEQTGVKIEFQHPASGQDNEQFNLMVTDGTYPDLWKYDWRFYPGGPSKALDDGIILDLTDIINEHCPAYRAYLDANPDIDKAVRTDDGRYYSFPTIREVDAMCCAQGPMIRRDWLEECELDSPETIEEWHTVLTAFKEKLGATAPYTTHDGSLPWAYTYGVCSTFRMEDGNVVFTAGTEEYKEFLKTMAQWWQEGLLDKDMFSGGDDLRGTKLTNGTSGATCGWVASGLQNMTLAAREEDSDFSLIGIKWPVINKGERPEYGYMDGRYTNGGIAIGANCKDPVLAAKVLDYGYTEAGYMLNNFGIEGVSYNMVDGEPVMSDEVLHNPNGWSIGNAWSNYARAPYHGSFIQSWGYQTQILQIDEAREALVTWGDTNMKAHLMPNASVSSEDSEEYASIMNELQTYVDEMKVKFIMGAEDVDAKYEEYLNTLKSIGVERATELMQTACDKYANR